MQSAILNYDVLLHSATLEKVGEKPVDLSIEVDIEKEISGKEEVWLLYQTFNDGFSIVVITLPITYILNFYCRAERNG